MRRVGLHKRNISSKALGFYFLVHVLDHLMGKVFKTRALHLLAADLEIAVLDSIADETWFTKHGALFLYGIYKKLVWISCKHLSRAVCVSHVHSLPSL